MRRLNNKGYMLVEIILAFALAMTVMYFLMELTIKLKNKNDDLVVRTLAATDQAIIYNTIMKEVYTGNFDCNNITISGKKFTYKYKDNSEFNNIVNKYVSEFKKTCGGGLLTIEMDVKQLKDDFDINIKYES